MIEKACPDCGTVLELLDMMDAYPPIPLSAWPERWSIHNGEGRGLLFCPALPDPKYAPDEPCGCPIEDFDLEPYPWEEEEWKAWDKRQREAQA